jgi:hypothetical protein
MVALAVEVWERLLKKEKIFGIKSASALFLSAIWALLICITLVVYVLIQIRNKYDMFYYLGAREFFHFLIIREYFLFLRESPVVVLTFALGLWFIWLVVFVLWPRLTGQVVKCQAFLSARRGFLAILLLGVAILFQYWFHRWYILGPQETLRRSSRFLTVLTADTPEPVIGGNWAPAFAMETKIMVFPLNKRVNGYDTFKKFPVTHLLLEIDAPEEEIFMFEQYPEEMERAVKIGEIKVGRWPVRLYKLEPGE